MLFRSAAAAASGSVSPPSPPSLPLPPTGIAIDLTSLDVRARPFYTGVLDAALTVGRAASSPALGGSVRLSKGVVSLVPPGGEGGAGDEEGDEEGGNLAAPPRPPPSARPSPTPPGLTLRGLDVTLGPDLRGVYPFVVNVALAGGLTLSGKLGGDGAAAPGATGALRVRGAISLDNGEINLLATQLVLDREHANRVLFDGGPALDPTLDLALRGAGVRASVSGCRASGWRQGLVLTPSAGVAGPAGGGGGEAAAGRELAAPDAARLFEAALARALVAADGQSLALSSLAASAAAGLLPRLETQGRLGGARWRLVSAPALPGLLSLDPSTGSSGAGSGRAGAASSSSSSSASATSALLESLALGTEVEVQVGPSLRAALARPLRDGDAAGAACTLTYALTRRLRVQFAVGGPAGPGPKSLVLQYSSDA